MFAVGKRHGLYDHLVFPWIINIELCLADHRKKESGQDTGGLDGIVCWFVPIYLFLRAEKFRHSNVYAWAWLACFAISFLIPIQYCILLSAGSAGY